MPGQYASGNEVSPDGIVHLESISPDVVVVRRHGVSHRRLAFYGSDGKTRHYSIHGSVSWLLGRIVANWPLENPGELEMRCRRGLLCN